MFRFLKSNPIAVGFCDELDKDFVKIFKRYNKKFPKLIELEGLDKSKLNPMKFYKTFIHSDNVANASIDANSNVNDNNVNTLRTESFKSQDKLLAYNKLFIEMKENYGLAEANKWFDYQFSGWVYLHDAFDAHLKPYCFSYSVKPIVDKGLFFIKEMSAVAPKHLSTFNHHILQFVSYASNQQSGAVGLSDYLFWSFYFFKKDVETGYIPEEIKDRVKIQEFQSVIFDLNQPFMKVIQSAYTNFTIIDRVGYDAMYGGIEFPDGTFAIDYMEDFMQYQKDWLTFVKELRRKKSFTFPVISSDISINKETKEFEDEDMAKFIIEHNMLWGDSNILYSEDPTLKSACCRMKFDTKAFGDKLEGRFSSISGSDTSIGSTKVNTINMARVGYTAKGDIIKAKEIIKELVENTHKLLRVHRIILQKNIDRGLLPLYTHGLIKLERQFGTVGITGFQEFVEAMGGIDRDCTGVKYNEKGLSLGKEILQYMNKLNEVTPKEYGFTSNIEQVPAESASVKLCKKDSLYFDIDYKLYSNQWIALSEHADMMERIRVASTLDEECGGGQMLHQNLAEPYSSFEQAYNFYRLLAKKGIQYFSDIRHFQYCKNDHNFFGNICDTCGEKAEGNIIKVVGYFVKDKYFSKERKEEKNNRLFYSRKSLDKLISTQKK